MRISGTTGTVLALVALAALGGGTYFFRTVQENRRLELQARTQQDRLKTKEAEARAKEAEAKTKESEARKAEADRKRAEAAAEEKRAVVAAKRQEEARAREQAAAATAAAKKATAEKAAADAAAKKAAAEKAASDAARAEQEKRVAAEAVALRRAEAERKTAEAARDEKLAATRIAEAALAKSANERKAAEATAAAEHDRKLRLYSRASLSRAETVALQRAERRLALEEAGLLAPEDNAGDGGMAPAEEAAGNTAGAAADGNAPTNAVVAVTWPEARPDATPAGVKVAEIQRKIDDTHRTAQNRAARRRIADFGRRIDQAVSEGRLADAAHERRALVSLVPDYVDVYIGLLDEARAANDEAAQKKRLDELVALVPDWRRVAVLVRLIQHDEAFYSRALAGRVEKDDYVKAFRKIYDAARRDKGDRDERDEKVAHICRVLATYVPDFERSPEWK